jgi:transcriptional regulator of acetoin/glycerol metabolism
VIERVTMLSGDREIQARDLPPEIRRTVAPSSLPAPPEGEVTLSSLDEIIRAHVLRMFRSHHENLSRTARALGISRVALRRRLREYGAKPKDPKKNGGCPSAPTP